jgi:anti-anti-sigma regulatory factor
MKITSRLEDQTLVLSLQGRLDAFHVVNCKRLLTRTFATSRLYTVIVDMSGSIP